MVYTEEEINKAMQLLEDIRKVMTRSHVSANQKIVKIFNLYERYDPEDHFWDLTHRRIG